MADRGAAGRRGKSPDRIRHTTRRSNWPNRSAFHEIAHYVPGTMNAVALPRPTVLLATGFRRRLYVGLGLLFVGIGILGALLPVLPTTPWLLIASYFFARSSPRLEAWLRRTPYFGPLIADWETHRGVRPRVKAQAICVVVLVVGCTCLFSRAPEWAKWSAASLAGVGVLCILFVVPTYRETVVPPVER
jgi:hypothetical protein